MQFSVITSLAIFAATIAAADELTTYSLVISRDDALFTKVITSTIGVTNLYAAQYHGDNAPPIYTVGNTAGSASFYSEVSETSVAPESLAAAETTNVPNISSSVSVETSVAIESTEAAGSPEASQSTSSAATSSEASISYEDGAVNAALSVGALGAAIAVFLI